MQKESKIPPLRLLAWETTRRCNLDCRHCRAAADVFCRFCLIDDAISQQTVGAQFIAPKRA